MSFLLINVFNIRGGGYMYSLPTSYKAVRATRRCSSPWYLRLHYRLGDCQPINAAFRYVKIYYYTNLLLAALAVLMWFCLLARLIKRCGWW